MKSESSVRPRFTQSLVDFALSTNPLQIQKVLSPALQFLCLVVLLLPLTGCHDSLSWKHANVDLARRQVEQQTKLLEQLPRDYDSLTGQAADRYDELFALADKTGTRTDGMKAHHYSIPNSGDDGSATTLIIFVVDEECIEGVLLEPAHL